MNIQNCGSLNELGELIEGLTQTVIQDGTVGSSPLREILYALPPRQRRNLIINGAMRQLAYRDHQERQAQIRAARGFTD
jgi:hypothetical protein